MVSLTKQESVEKINLRKDKVVSLKKANPALDIKARVALVLDFSGSMRDMFDDGTVQSVIERVIPIALSFDDNGVLDFWIFENGFHRLDGITLDNFYGLANQIRSKYTMGGTRYAPVLKDVDKFYIKEEPEKIVDFVIFITDGDNSDKSDATDIIRRMSYHPIFIQFLGVGSSSFDYLEDLDNMEDRYVDNVNFFSINDINSMSDDDLYSLLLKEFPQWLNLDKVKDMLEIGIPEAPEEKKGFFARLFGG